MPDLSKYLSKIFPFLRKESFLNHFFVFALKLAILTVPFMVTLALLRSDPDVQKTMSSSFPLYHLAKLIMVSAGALLSAFGYSVTLAYDTHIYYYDVFSLQIAGGIQTFIGFSCLGVGVSWVFASLIIAGHGRVKPKLLYVLLGVIVIFILNVLRMAYLTWIGRDGSIFTAQKISLLGLAEVDHHDLFNIFIYIVIILLYALWFEITAPKRSKPQK